tara:strand:- start:47 stop:877 length:831 start_codon:yes stop_codon:yes gene_type:complete
MNIKNRLTNLSYSFIKKYSSLLDNNQLRVINIHNIDQNQFSELEMLILDLKKNSWQFITPTEFLLLKNNPNKILGKNVLVTFDDGYKSQYEFAKIILKKYNIKAIFFVINEFVLIKDEYKNNFIKNKLFPNTINVDISKFDNMKLSQLKELIDDNHMIGAHTKSHRRLSNIKYENELKDEIIVAADELQSLLNYKIKNFAYTFGDINSINKLSINLASKRFDFIFSGLRGNNLKKSKIVAREAINFYSDITLNHAILNGIYDLFYKTKLNKLKKWV